MKKKGLIKVAAIVAMATGLCLSSSHQAEAGIDWGQILFGGGASSSGGSGSIDDAISGKQKHAVKQINSNHKLLFLGIDKNDADIVKAALQTGVDINGVYSQEVTGCPCGNTPLGHALSRRKIDIMQLLLENGADIDGFYDYSNKRISYLVWAASERNYELVKYIHSWGASVNSEAETTHPFGQSYNNTKINAAHAVIVTSMGRDDDSAMILDYLIENGINLETRVDGGSEIYTPFLEAVGRGWYRCVDVLAAGGANLSAKTNRGRNAMQIAIDGQNLDMYKYLQEVFARGQQPSKYIPENPTYRRAGGNANNAASGAGNRRNAARQSKPQDDWE